VTGWLLCIYNDGICDIKLTPAVRFETVLEKSDERFAYIADGQSIGLNPTTG